MSQIQEKFKRLLQTMQLIQNTPGINSTEIADKLKTSTRTVQRYIKELREAGVPIEASAGHMGGFACSRGYEFQPIYFTTKESIVLTLAAQTLLNQKGFPFRNELESAVQKINSSMKHAKLNPTESTHVSVMIPPRGNYDKYQSLIDSLNKVIQSCQRVVIKYDSFSSQQISERKIDPLHIMFRDGFWYLVAYCHSRKMLRMFRVDRIKQLQILDELFEAVDFDIEEYIKNSWSIAKGEKTKVAVRFSPPISRLIEEAKWHESQEIEKLDSGNLILHLEVEETWEIKKWILGFGKYAEVLEPLSLRKEIREELGEMVEMYASPDR